MYKVLLVDDEQIERMALAKKIEKYYGDKVDIYHAVDGREAVDMCSRHKKDIIIMDISMPEMNGVMAARYIRQMDDKCSIIFLSAYDDFEYARNAIKVRALDYLLKPCELDDLLAVMDVAIQKLDADTSGMAHDKSDISEHPDNFMDYNIQNDYKEDTRFIYEECRYNMDNKETGIEKIGNIRNADEKTVIKCLKNYVENNYMYDISMQEAAEKMGYSDAYFSKLFKQYFNQNFTAYLTEFRIRKASKLLIETDESIKDISGMVGYADSNYFTKIFKRITGEIPSKYRENNN